MKSVIALALVAGALAAPGGWSDAPVKEYTTTTTVPVKPATTTVPTYWADVTTTTPKKPVVGTTTTDDDCTETETWSDYTGTPKKPVVPATTTTTATYWADYKKPVTTTTTTKVVDTLTTYCPTVPTTIYDKHDKYVINETTTLTLTKGPYTVYIPVYEETSTVCPEEPTPTPAVPIVKTPYTTTTTPAPTGSYTPVKPATPVQTYTGSASKLAGAGLAGVAAFAALLL